MGRQTGVDRVRHLIEVVADPPQFGEQHRLHPMDGRLCDLDLGIEQQDFAVSGQLHAGAEGIAREPRVVIVRYADVDLPVTLLRRLHFRAGHFTPH